MSLLPKRRWLRYSVRTLLIAVTIFCVWLGYYANWKRERQSMLESLNGYSRSAINAENRSVPFGLRLLGEGPIRDIELRGDSAESALAIIQVSEVFPEAQISAYLRCRSPSCRQYKVGHHYGITIQNGSVIAEMSGTKRDRNCQSEERLVLNP